MGIRVGADSARNAVLELDASGAVAWINASDEHKWLMPRAATTKQIKLREAHKEFHRLIGKYVPDKVILKIAESMPGRAGASTHRVALEAAITLAADQHGKNVTEKRYRQLKHNAKEKMNSSTVEGFVLAHVAKPAIGWDKELVDAVAVALRALQKCACTGLFQVNNVTSTLCIP